MIKYVIKSKVRRDGILAVLLKMRLDLEIIEETITREDLCGFLAMCGLRSETHPRCSTLFLFELYIRARTTVVPGDPMKIIAEVQAMEGYGRASRTKEATQFKHPPLRGLWHKHYLAHNGFMINTMQELGGPNLKRLPALIEQQRRPGATHWTVEDVPGLASAVAGSFSRRAARAELTGEWIVYATHEGQHYYLCLGSHTDGDQSLCDRILQQCSMEFPFLETQLATDPPDENE